MNPNSLGLIAIVMSLAAFAWSHAQLRHRTLAVRSAALGILSLLSAPALLFGLYYLHILQERQMF